MIYYELLTKVWSPNFVKKEFNWNNKSKVFYEHFDPLLIDYGLYNSHSERLKQKYKHLFRKGSEDTSKFFQIALFLMFNRFRNDQRSILV